MYLSRHLSNLIMPLSNTWVFFRETGLKEENVSYLVPTTRLNLHRLRTTEKDLPNVLYCDCLNDIPVYRIFVYMYTAMFICCVWDLVTDRTVVNDLKWCSLIIHIHVYIIIYILY
jgi:hypothetical protein